jgi:hypothetical protein
MPATISSNGPFFLGIRTTHAGSYFHGGQPDTYGWVRLDNNHGNITMLGNAVAYDASGIRVGGTNAIALPEPAAGTILLAGAALAPRRWRRRRPLCARG